MSDGKDGYFNDGQNNYSSDFDEEPPQFQILPPQRMIG